MRKILLLLLCIGLFGCATTSGTMKSWIGETETKLLSSWGAPDNALTLSDGSKVYTWKRLWGNGNLGRQTFTISAEGKVISWAYDNMPSLQKAF